MTDDERLHQALRSAFPPVMASAPSRDLWADVVRRSHGPARWSWLDAGLAAAGATALLLFPDWLWFLAYHL
jgi:hypothetical protein